jgi:hypothetical protein
MTDTKLLTIVCLCLLIGLAGCDTTDRPAKVDVDIENASVEGEQVRLAGEVTLTGGTHNVTLHEVQLRFTAEDGSTIRTLPIGTMNDTAGVGFTRVDYNTTLFKPPEELRLRIDTIDKPTDADLIVKGKRLEDEDELRYGPLQQDEYLRATLTFLRTRSNQ